MFVQYIHTDFCNIVVIFTSLDTTFSEDIKK